METSRQEKESLYSEIVVSSFEEAVDYLRRETEEDESKFCLVDIDGTLLSENILKFPFLCHVMSPTVSDGVRESFSSLVSDVFVDENIVVITNRNDSEKVLWNSDKVLRSVREVCCVPILTFLNRQIPGLNRNGCANLLNRISEYAKGKGFLTIYSIEDQSFVSPFRNHFLGYIARKLEMDCDFDIRVVNLVIKR